MGVGTGSRVELRDRTGPAAEVALIRNVHVMIVERAAVVELEPAQH